MDSIEYNFIDTLRHPRSSLTLNKQQEKLTSNRKSPWTRLISGHHSAAGRPSNARGDGEIEQDGGIQRGEVYQMYQILEDVELKLNRIDSEIESTS